MEENLNKQKRLIEEKLAALNKQVEAYHETHVRLTMGVCARPLAMPVDSEISSLYSQIHELEDELEDINQMCFDAQVASFQHNENNFIDAEYLKKYPKGLGVEYVTITYITKNSIGFMCSNSHFVTLNTRKGISSDLYVGQSFYA